MFFWALYLKLPLGHTPHRKILTPPPLLLPAFRFSNHHPPTMSVCSSLRQQQHFDKDALICLQSNCEVKIAYQMYSHAEFSVFF